MSCSCSLFLNEILVKVNLTDSASSVPLIGAHLSSMRIKNFAQVDMFLISDQPKGVCGERVKM